MGSQETTICAVVLHKSKSANKGTSPPGGYLQLAYVRNRTLPRSDCSCTVNPISQ